MPGQIEDRGKRQRRNLPQGRFEPHRLTLSRGTAIASTAHHSETGKATQEAVMDRGRNGERLPVTGVRIPQPANCEAAVVARRYSPHGGRRDLRHVGVVPLRRPGIFRPAGVGRFICAVGLFSVLTAGCVSRSEIRAVPDLTAGIRTIRTVGVLPPAGARARPALQHPQDLQRPVRQHPLERCRPRAQADHRGHP